MSAQRPTRVLVLGGGFGGVTTARELAKRFQRDRSVEITLVNRDNYFVYVPLLASAAAGSIEALHVVAPIRRLIGGAHFRAEEVTAIDLRNRVVTTGSPTTGRERQLPFDHLVISLGNVINLSRLPGVAQHGKTIKTLGDALAIRNHVLQMLEAADIETDPVTRREMLTFVVAGGGFSGVEMVGELNDLVRDVIRHYPSITREQVRIVLLHSQERILPEMSARIAEYALRELGRRGVEAQLNVRLAGATPHEAVLEGGAKIPTRTLIVAVGNAPPPVLENLAIPKERGRIVVDAAMRVPGMDGVWALGDNAIVPNGAENGAASPPTAQYALRQGKTLAYNIAAAIQGRQPKPFAFGGLGLLCLVGHGAGVGELKFGVKLRGFLGWFMWRGVYWSKLPNFGRKVQVGAGWLLDMIVPRELAQINLSRTQTVGRAHYEAGEFIFRQGDSGDHFYLITDGEVEVIREHSSGHQSVLARLGRGEYFGETALLTSRRRNATIRCITPVDVVTLGRDDFATLANTWLQFASGLRATSDERLAQAPVTTWIPGIAAAAAQARSTDMPSFDGGQAFGPAHLLRRDSGGEVALDRDLISFGRAPDNHIVVPDPAVSRRHALIQRDGVGYWVEDLGGANGTWVNGARVGERQQLRENDVVRIGRTEFVFQAPRTTAAPAWRPPAPAAQLVRSTTGEMIPLSRDLMAVGRGSDNDVVVIDPGVSRRHALIQRDGAGYWVEDLGGLNGTWVNGRRIGDRTPLRPGDVIGVGAVEFAFEAAGQAPPAPAPRPPAPVQVPAPRQGPPPSAAPSPPQAPPATPGPPPGAPVHAGPPPPFPPPAAGVDPRHAPLRPPPVQHADPSLTGVINTLLPNGPRPPGAPAPPGDESLTSIIRGLDAPPRPPAPAGPPGPPSTAPPGDGSLTGIIRGLDGPPPAPPADPSSLTGIIQALDPRPAPGPPPAAAPAHPPQPGGQQAPPHAVLFVRRGTGRGRDLRGR
ncbi:MAG: FAD-dependent oxidoreductase [Dehalococcoidia bacterium]